MIKEDFLDLGLKWSVVEGKVEVEGLGDDFHGISLIDFLEGDRSPSEVIVFAVCSSSMFLRREKRERECRNLLCLLYKRSN